MTQGIATGVKEHIITITCDCGNFFSHITRYHTHKGALAAWSTGDTNSFRLRLDMQAIKRARQPQEKVPVEFYSGWMVDDPNIGEHLHNYSFAHHGGANGNVKKPGFLALTLPYLPGVRQLQHPPRWCADKGEVLDFVHADEMRPDTTPRLVVVLGLRAPFHIYRLSLCRERCVRHLYLYEKALRW